MGYDMTFSMWSFGHYLFLLSPFILTTIVTLITKNYSMNQKQRLGIGLSIVAVVVLLLRNLEIWIGNDFTFDVELVPLQVCHFANFVILIAFITKKQILFNFSLILNMPAAFVSILFANSLTNYSTILNFRGFAYIVGHALLVFIPIWAYNVGFIKLNMKTFIKTLKVFSLLYGLSIIINNLMYVFFGSYSNYFYTLKPESGTPLEMFFEFGQEGLMFEFFKFNPVYVILTGLFGLLFMFIFYLGFNAHQQKMSITSLIKKIAS